MNVTYYGYFEFVVMTMPVYMVALPECIAIPLIALIRVMQAMSRIKMSFSCYKYQSYSGKNEYCL